MGHTDETPVLHTPSHHISGVTTDAKPTHRHYAAIGLLPAGVPASWRRGTAPPRHSRDREDSRHIVRL